MVLDAVHMGKKTDILDGLSGATPALRRYARALCAGAGAAIADELVQNSLKTVGVQVRAQELRPADHGEARIETYAALTALANRKLAAEARPASRQPLIVHSLAALSFDDRAALLLVSLEGFSYEAAARIVGTSRETVLARLMRARAEIGGEGWQGAVAESANPRRASHLRVVK